MTRGVTFSQGDTDAVNIFSGSFARTDSADEGYLDAAAQLCCVCKGNVNGRLICITRIVIARNYNVTFSQGIR